MSEIESIEEVSPFTPEQFEKLKSPRKGEWTPRMIEIRRKKLEMCVANNANGASNGVMLSALDEITRLQSALAEANDRIAEYQADAERVLSETCPSDEKHCACVPTLRKALAEAEQKLSVVAGCGYTFINDPDAGMILSSHDWEHIPAPRVFPGGPSVAEITSELLTDSGWNKLNWNNGASFEYWKSIKAEEDFYYAISVSFGNLRGMKFMVWIRLMNIMYALEHITTMNQLNTLYSALVAPDLHRKGGEG